MTAGGYLGDLVANWYRAASNPIAACAAGTLHRRRLYATSKPARPSPQPKPPPLPPQQPLQHPQACPPSQSISIDATCGSTTATSTSNTCRGSTYDNTTCGTGDAGWDFFWALAGARPRPRRCGVASPRLLLGGARRPMMLPFVVGRGMMTRLDGGLLGIAARGIGFGVGRCGCVL